MPKTIVVVATIETLLIFVIFIVAMIMYYQSTIKSNTTLKNSTLTIIILAIFSFVLSLSIAIESNSSGATDLIKAVSGGKGKIVTGLSSGLAFLLFIILIVNIIIYSKTKSISSDLVKNCVTTVTILGVISFFIAIGLAVEGGIQSTPAGSAKAVALSTFL